MQPRTQALSTTRLDVGGGVLNFLDEGGGVLKIKVLRLGRL
jgi:hypothetical protein